MVHNPARLIPWDTCTHTHGPSKAGLENRTKDLR